MFWLTRDVSVKGERKDERQGAKRSRGVRETRAGLSMGVTCCDVRPGRTRLWSHACLIISLGATAAEGF